MAAYMVDTEDGQYFVEPDSSKMCTLIAELSGDNSFLVILPDTDTPTWHASITREDVGYLVERRDENGHDTTDPATIATDLITWLQKRA